MYNVNDAMALGELKRAEIANKKYTVFKQAGEYLWEFV